MKHENILYFFLENDDLLTIKEKSTSTFQFLITLHFILAARTSIFYMFSFQVCKGGHVVLKETRDTPVHDFLSHIC